MLPLVLRSCRWRALALGAGEAGARVICRSMPGAAAWKTEILRAVTRADPPPLTPAVDASASLSRAPEWLRPGRAGASAGFWVC